MNRSLRLIVLLASRDVDHLGHGLVAAILREREDHLLAQLGVFAARVVDLREVGDRRTRLARPE